MYEVVHVEKASSSSTSTPTKQEKKLATGQAVPPTPDSLQTHIERISESLSPNVVSGSMSVKKAQVEKHIPLEEPSLVVMPAVVEQQPTALKPGLENPTTTSNWGIKHFNPLQRQQEPYTALGIPATARSSGLQHMASYSANHTHVFLDPVTNTIPLSWQYPFTGHTTTVTTSSVPTLGPFPSVVTPSNPKPTTVPVLVFEHFPLNATATIVPCSEPGVDSRKRDSAGNNTKVAEGGPSKAPSAPKSLTKEENTKLLVGLARRLCLAGLEQTKKNLGTLATNVQRGKSLELQGVLQATIPWMK